jgi:hypothetical protein
MFMKVKYCMSRKYLPKNRAIKSSVWQINNYKQTERVYY